MDPKVREWMRAVVYSQAGEPDVLRLVERPVPDPGPGEVRVRVSVSGVNPTDWKARRGSVAGEPVDPAHVPNQDGAGTVDAVGEGVDPSRVGERVWLWEAAYQRIDGTAQEFVVLPERQAVRLADGVSFDVGASLGIPALTAQICLTASELGPRRLTPGALSAQTVLVSGGAGAVGHAAIQLARWAGARVIATVSGDEKAGLARAAGAQHIVNYRAPGAADEILSIAPDGVDVIVEVSAGVNAGLDTAVLASNGTVTPYATDGGSQLGISVGDLMGRNVRYQFVLVYTVTPEVKDAAVADVVAAAADGALEVGADAGLPLHRFPLEQTAAAHTAVEGGAVGKVLIDVA
jgi:NADPH:quinone reductase